MKSLDTTTSPRFLDTRSGLSRLPMRSLLQLRSASTSASLGSKRWPFQQHTSATATSYDHARRTPHLFRRSISQPLRSVQRAKKLCSRSPGYFKRPEISSRAQKPRHGASQNHWRQSPDSTLRANCFANSIRMASICPLLRNVQQISLSASTSVPLP